MLVKILNGLIDVLEWIATAFFMLLPDTPFQFAPLDWGPFGQAVGFFFPVQSMFLHMSLIIASFLAYYMIRWVLRIIRAVR